MGKYFASLIICVCTLYVLSQAELVKNNSTVLIYKKTMSRFKEVIENDKKLWINPGLEPGKFFTTHYAVFWNKIVRIK